MKKGHATAKPPAPPEPPAPRPWISARARLRNYFLTGLIVAGPLAITIYIAWWFIQLVDGWVKPFVPAAYLPETYLPFTIPGYDQHVVGAGDGVAKAALDPRRRVDQHKIELAPEVVAQRNHIVGADRVLVARLRRR